MSFQFKLRTSGFQKVFVDKATVLAAIDRATLDNFTKAGALLRRIAMNSIRPAPWDRHASPGSPPLDHVGFVNNRVNQIKKRFGVAPVRLKGDQRGLRNILFGVDTSARSLMVGPSQTSKPYGGTITVPQLLEFGGTVTKRNGESMRVAPHPFMRPALEKAATSRGGDSILNLWRNSVR